MLSYCKHVSKLIPIAGPACKQLRFCHAVCDRASASFPLLIALASNTVPCRRADVAARIRAAWDEAQRSGKLSARQAARIADMSLLLDVVLKTNTLRWACCIGVCLPCLSSSSGAQDKQAQVGVGVAPLY